MEAALQIAKVVGGLILMAAFVTGFAAHLVLQFYIDHRRVKEETGEPGWKAFGAVFGSVDFYKQEGRVFWTIRDKALKIFVISVGVFAVMAVTAAIFDIPLK